MTGEHYEEWELVAYLDRNDTAVDIAAVAAHLETCAACGAAVASLQEFMPLLTDPDVYDFAERISQGPDAAHLAEALALVERFDNEDRAASITFAALLEMPIEQWTEYLAGHPDLRTEGLIRRLVTAARDEFDRRPEFALDLLSVASGVANTFGDVHALAHHRGTIAKERANALYMLGRYQDALNELDWATRFFDHLAVHAFDLALVEWVRATVYLHMTLYEDALTLVRRVIRMLTNFGDVARGQQARLLEAGILYEMGTVDVALERFRPLAVYFDESGDTSTLARVKGNIAECEMRLGLLDASRAHAEEAARLHDAVGQQSEKTRVERTLAQVLVREGRTDEALEALAAVADAFQAMGMKAEAGDALLDMVEIYIRADAWEDALPLARSLAELFTAIGAPVYAAQAYAYLREAVEARRANIDLVAYVRSYVAAADAARTFAPPDH